MSLVLAACAATDPGTRADSRADAVPVRVLERPSPDPIDAAIARRVVDDASIDTTLGALFVRARALVEAESGTDLSSVALRLVDDEAILAEVSVETRRLVRGQLGDGPLAERLLASLVHGQIGTYAALYAGRHRTVMVSRDVLASYLESLPATSSAREDALLVLMLHELVHAADDIRHDIHAGRALDFRASFAQSAAYEGHAQWMTRTICRREGCLDGLRSLDAFMFDTHGAPVGMRGDDAGSGPRRAGTAAERPSPIDRKLLEYSYVEGERFVTALAGRAGGPELIERVLAEPPHDPLQILDPASFPDVAREDRNRALLAAAGGVEHPWIAGPDARVPVPTSPLKGVDLRDDPERRAAAIDGFTRLVTAMVAVQFHDPGERARPPVEVTLMRTDRPATAGLFADTLHAHARLPGATVIAPERRVAGHAGTDVARETRLLRTERPIGDGDHWATAVASAGPFVVQASGRTGSRDALDAYVLAVLDALLAGEPA